MKPRHLGNGQKLGISTAFLALVLTSCVDRAHRYTIGEVEETIRTGKAPKEITEYATKRGPLTVRELSVGLPIQLFVFENETHSHTLVVDGKDLVLIAGGPRNQTPDSFQLQRDGSVWILRFKFRSSQDGTEISGQYIFRHKPQS